MKANLKGLGGIKGFFLVHGEKLVIAAIGVCVLLMIYYATRVERLESRYQADQLQNQIRQTETDIKAASWNTAVTEHPDEVRVMQKRAKSVVQEVDPQLYGFRGVDPPVIRATSLRPDPALLAAEDVRATGLSGLLPFIDEQVTRERQLKRQAKEAQDAKERTEREAREAKEGERGGRQGNRGDRRDGFGADLEKDPEHPNRRPLETAVRPPGAQVTGDEKVKRAVWSVVVAKVPIKEQLRVYRTAFENARGGFDPSVDFPSYAGYVVERAEVRAGQPLQWAAVDVYDGQGNKLGPPPAMTRTVMDKLMRAVQSTWAAQLPELVDERYIDFERLLAYPLPPMLGRDWGAEITHPDIPLAIDAPPPELEEEPVDEDPSLQPVGEGLEDGFTGRDASGGLQHPGATMGGSGRYAGGAQRGPGARYGGGGAGRYGGGGHGGTGYPVAGGAGSNQMLPKVVTHWLLRFFDFSVEPGKQYKYRVRMVLDDPNAASHIDISSLDSEALNRLREARKGRPATFSIVRFTDWSEPSPTVGIPLSGSVRLATTKMPAGNLFNDEPSMTLLVESFDLDSDGNAILAAVERVLRRGDVANSMEEAEFVTSDHRWIDKIKDFKFFTGITVIDVDGGEKLTRELQAPARVLLMNSAGQLYVRNELDDEAAVKVHKEVFAEPDRNSRGGRDEAPAPGGRYGSGRGGRR